MKFPFKVGNVVVDVNTGEEYTVIEIERGWWTIRDNVFIHTTTTLRKCRHVDYKQKDKTNG